MLCLSTGSACDVCLEPFGGELKAPSALECGHVFCTGCLNQITRTSCPLCRKSYDPRRSIELIADVDGAPRISESRPYFDRIAKAVVDGCDESTVKHLVEECRSFIKDQPRSREFEDFRVVVRMFGHIYDTKVNLKQTKRKSRDDAVKSQEELVKLQEEFLQHKENMKLEIERLRSTELSLYRDLSRVQQDNIDLRKLVSDDNDSLQEQLRNLRVGAHHDKALPPSKSLLNISPEKEELKLKGSSLMDEGYFLSPLPDFEPGKLFPSPQVEAGPLTSETTTPAIPIPPPLPIHSVRRPPLPTPPSSARSPSLLSMTAPGKSNMQAEYFPHPIPPISVSSPRSSPPGDSIQDTQTGFFPHPIPPVPISSHSEREVNPIPSQDWVVSSVPDNQEPVVYRQAGPDRLRSRFMSIMHDSSPTISSSMPNLAGEHFFSNTPSRGDKSPLPVPSPGASSSRPVSSSRSLDSASLDPPSSPQPISLPPVKPIATVTPSSSYSQASLAAAAQEDARRQRRFQEEGERRRKDSERSREGKEGSRTPAGSPPREVLDARPANEAPRDGDRSAETRRPSRKHSYSSGHQYSSSSGYHQSSGNPSPLGPHGQQESASFNKAYEGRSNSSTRPVTSPSKPPPPPPPTQQLKGTATVGATAPRDPPAYRPSTYSSMGTSKGKAASAILSNQSGVPVA
ncbi:hypothetical protein V5O48_006542 [Marasmius crinis-equi]|uniref:RING-type domain-containing protein n=1 Tax=Marasmius crinis-equi TaxID=585013 RepID=A0ABR3FJ70_9AGAR